MSKGHDQLGDLQRAARRYSVAGVIVTGAAAVWAAWPPLVTPPLIVQLSTPAAQPKHVKSPPFDLAVFNAPIWNPTPPPKPPAPLPALRLQLIAIAREMTPDGSERFRAAVYDPDANELSQVIAGERIAGRQVMRVTATELEVSDNTGSRRLVLDTLSTGPSVSGTPANVGGVP